MARKKQPSIPLAKIQEIIETLHLCAYRYCDGRQTYITGDFNRITRNLLALGFDLNHTFEVEGRLFVRDGMGSNFSGLTKEEYDSGIPEDWFAKEKE